MRIPTSLFGLEPVGFDPSFAGVRRIALDADAWVEHLPGWLRGHERVLDALRDTTRWRAERRRMYEQTLDVPRLTARLPEDGPGHPVLAGLAEALSKRYGWTLDRISLAWYRDGRDSVAWHGDRMGRLRRDCVVATVSLGAPRRFLLRPARGGASRAFALGWGDLFVMGGSCQATHQHCVPKARQAEPRVSVMFRPCAT